MLLEVKNLSVQFGEGPRAARAVNNVSLAIDVGETVALVGESGCGKSVSGLSLMRLIETPPGRITSGEIYFEGVDLLKLPLKRMRAIRGSDIAMVFQEPMTSFNPVYTIGDQLTEAVLLHEKCTRQQAHTRAEDLLTEVGIPAPSERLRQYPHELSGGMKQRAMIAMGLLCKPKLLIADEPTTALDVTVQAQILDLLRELQVRHGMAVLLITHDLAVVAETVKRVYVMYASEIVEHASVEELFRDPLHPYTIGLFKCLPKMDGKRDELNVIRGSVPNPSNLPSGCHFHPRCPLAQPICSEVSPSLEEKRPGRLCACHMVEKL